MSYFFASIGSEYPCEIFSDAFESEQGVVRFLSFSLAELSSVEVFAVRVIPAVVVESAYSFLSCFGLNGDSIVEYDCDVDDVISLLEGIDDDVVVQSII